jgi:hypothetical protein
LRVLVWVWTYLDHHFTCEILLFEEEKKKKKITCDFTQCEITRDFNQWGGFSQKTGD